MAERRSYDSPVRREQAAATRERIIAAGSELVHGFGSWDWRELTVRAVAAHAGVNERTVYRHFANERALRDAVMARLEEEAGIDLTELDLDSFRAVIGRFLAYLGSFAIPPRTEEDPTFATTDRRRREALVAGLVGSTPGWSDTERTAAAAMLDVFWNVPTYERLRGAWELDADQTEHAISWVIGLIEEAIRGGERPGAGRM